MECNTYILIIECLDYNVKVIVSIRVYYCFHIYHMSEQERWTDPGIRVASYYASQLGQKIAKIHSKDNKKAAVYTPT